MPNKRHGTPGYVPAGDLSTCMPKVLFNRQGLLKKFRSNNKFVESPRSHVNQHPEKIILTRRRWDAYMLPLFLAATAIGVLRVWQTGQFQFALAPVAVIPVWLMLRVQTPRDGMRVTTIRSTPGAVVLLWFMAGTLISMALLFALDIYGFEHPFRAPLEPYHAALFAPPFIIMFTGAFWADRIAKSKKSKEGARVDDETASRKPSTNKPMNPSGGSGVS